jgi:regulator of RNase E activity RraA
MSDARERIVDLISTNRISTSEVSDCLGKTGALKGATALNRGHSAVGPVHFVYAYNCSNWELHEQVQHVGKGEVVICEAIECGDYGLFGALVAKFLILYRGAAAVVIRGLVRDAAWLIRENFPIWTEGVTPLGCFNRKNETGPDPALLEELNGRYEGAIAVCDDSGVVVIPGDQVNETLIDKLQRIELQEDAWFHSIDTDKLTTYETVCLRKYMEHGTLFERYERLREDI